MQRACSYPRPDPCVSRAQPTPGRAELSHYIEAYIAEPMLDGYVRGLRCRCRRAERSRHTVRRLVWTPLAAVPARGAQREHLLPGARTEGHPIGDRVADQVVHGSTRLRVGGEETVFFLAHQQPLAFERSTDAVGDVHEERLQLLLTRCGDAAKCRDACPSDRRGRERMRSARARTPSPHRPIAPRANSSLLERHTSAEFTYPRPSLRWQLLTSIASRPNTFRHLDEGVRS